jgi:hypothetical protein
MSLGTYNIYNMKNQFLVVGCGLGWTVIKKVWADYEQLFKSVFMSKKYIFFF